MDTSALAKPVVGENNSLSLRRREQAEVGEDLGRTCIWLCGGERREGWIGSMLKQCL